LQGKSKKEKGRGKKGMQFFPAFLPFIFYFLPFLNLSLNTVFASTKLSF